MTRYSTIESHEGQFMVEEEMPVYGTGNQAVDLSMTLALETIRFCERLEKDGKFVVSNQFLKCGTSVGANISEAQEAESRADFIHKMKIASKEIREVLYWATVCQHAEGYPVPEKIIEIATHLNRLLNKIIITSKSTNKRK